MAEIEGSDAIILPNERVWAGTAAKPGPEHYRLRTNRQDQTFLFRSGKWIIGAVADGCSASPQSEAGAALLAHAAVQTLWLLVEQQLPLSHMTGAFDRMMGTFVHQLVAAHPGGQQFLSGLTMYDRAIDLSDPSYYLVYSMVANTLQATVLAACVHEDEGGLVIVRGDGAVHLDGELKVFDYDNHPPYLSYLLAIRGQEYPGRPEDLHSKTVLVPPGFKQIGVTTDGWPWQLPEAFPFGRWRYTSFQRWLRDTNMRRAAETIPRQALTKEQAWPFYRPDAVDNLARKLVKDCTDPTRGQPAFTDDIGGIFIEREVL